MIHLHEQLVAEKGDDVNIELENKISKASAIAESEVFFAKQRYGLHVASPDEGFCASVLQNYFKKVYGF